MSNYTYILNCNILKVYKTPKVDQLWSEFKRWIEGIIDKIGDVDSPDMSLNPFNWVARELEVRYW